tara:strand:+ start:73 stop:342 length:270 start_codon:yes stop_codon:yes gene_type:complete
MTYETITTFVENPSLWEEDCLDTFYAMLAFTAQQRTLAPGNLFGTTYQEWNTDQWLALHRRIDAIIDLEEADDSWVIGLGDASRAGESQ